MRLSFRAVAAGVAEENGALVCGVYDGNAEYLSFSVAVPDDGSGVYLEYRDQINADYNCVALCRLDTDRLSVDLTDSLDTLAGVTGFDIELALDAEAQRQLRDCLKRVFARRPGVLVVA